MTQIDHLKQVIIEQVSNSTDANLLDFILKLLFAES
jgi:hypothetical protein